MEQAFGSLTMILGIVMAVIAFPSQIIKNFREKRCGLSFIMVCIPLCIFISRSCYAFIISSWYIMIPDLIGMIASVVLLSQYTLYRRKGATK